ncbi:MAG: hypothetical protein HY043_24665 [Verrucomicrobia bacterium]|nr:hypothetical protein [Verrucomicrobiota bacterium]
MERKNRFVRYSSSAVEWWMLPIRLIDPPHPHLAQKRQHRDQLEYSSAVNGSRLQTNGFAVVTNSVYRTSWRLTGLASIWGTETTPSCEIGSMPAKELICRWTIRCVIASFCLMKTTDFHGRLEGHRK